CRLLVQPFELSANIYGCYQPAVANGALYFLTYGALETLDLGSLERRTLYGSSNSMVLDYGIAETFAIVSDPSGLVRVELADGKATAVAPDRRGGGFTLRGDTWYFASGNLVTMPREGGAVTETGINDVATFAIFGDRVYFETGFSLGTDVTLTSLSNP